MTKSLQRIVGGAVGVAACCVALATSVGASSPSAAALIASAKRDALARSAVHELLVSKRGDETLTMINDIGPTGGRQVISISNGSLGEVIALDSRKKAYFKGNKVGLKEYFGFPAADATKYAGYWIAVLPSDGAWANVTSSTTLTSDFDTDLRIVHPKLATKTVTIDGVRAYVITGKVAAGAQSPAATVTLDLSDASSVLPLKITESAKGTTVTVTWSKWGEALSLKAPSTSVPLP